MSGTKLALQSNNYGASLNPSIASTPFLLVPCNSDTSFLSQSHLPLSKCVSLMSVNQPGAFLRHAYSIINVSTDSGDPFIYDSSFILHENQFYPGYYALQATTSCCQNYYIQVQSDNYNVKINQVSSTSLQDETNRASFAISNPSGEFTKGRERECVCVCVCVCDGDDLSYYVSMSMTSQFRDRASICMIPCGQSLLCRFTGGVFV